MDYKEKLRLAKEALESGSYDKDTIEYIFPELTESDDERIRKALIRFHKSTIDVDGIKGEEILAWLEKQGDKKSFDDLTQQEAMDIAVAKCFEQDEQNPTDKVEPKIKVKYAGCEYNVLEVKDIVGVTYYGIEDEPNHIDYVKADNCKIISGGYGIKENGSPYPTKTAVFSEQKPAWSEEDKEMLEDTCRILSNSKECTTSNVRWLKSLRPQNKWKPSDEQIKAIKWVMDGDNPENWSVVLKNLYQDLKKLK